MPKFLLPPAAQVSRPILSLNDAVDADQHRLHKAQQWFQQPTPTPSPSPETLSITLPRVDVKFEPQHLPLAKPIALPPSPSASTPAYAIPKRNHTARRAVGPTQRPPRPRNAFILYRSDVIANGRINTNQQNEASAIAGRMWKMEDNVTKERYQVLAAEEKARHALMYPDYKYSPGTKKVSASAPAVKASPSMIRPRPSTKRLRAEDDDEAEWGELVSARPRHAAPQMKKPRLSAVIPTPEPSPEPSPSPELEIVEVNDNTKHLTLHINADTFNVPEFVAESTVAEDVDAMVSDNAMFANFFASHQKLLETYSEVLEGIDSQPIFSMPSPKPCQFVVPPTHRVPCLDVASFAAYRPSASFEDRSQTPIKPTHSYPRRLPEFTAQDASFSLHVSDDMLFKDTVIADALQPMNVFETAIRPVCPLWMMDAKDLTKEQNSTGIPFSK